MSRVGMLPVEVPDGVDLQIDSEGVRAKGKLGELSVSLTDAVEVSREDNLVWVKPANTSKRARTMWGTTRSLINNIVTGVSAVSVPPRATTTTCSTLGELSSASSAFDFSGTTAPRRHPPSAVMSTFA